ncbi:hypothetical protein Godav_025280 [Gossypium davidsonii]|uniref:Uncharacterized protein n=1 Tax=Gossypium davidsonii TaxID=34287 RepID=A0A7J8TDJ4_GOSDV|nr:hypothetical protein [Gossypium davidsonii]
MCTFHGTLRIAINIVFPLNFSIAQCNSLCHPVTDLRTSRNERTLFQTSRLIGMKIGTSLKREDSLEESPSGSPAISSTEDKRSQEFQDSYVTNSSGAEKIDPDEHDNNSTFGLGDFNIKPIRTQSSQTENLFPRKGPFTFEDSVPRIPAYIGDMFHGKSSSIFADSIPSSPAYKNKVFKGKSSSIFADSVPNSPAYADNMFKGKSSSSFADSVPSTPAYADNMFKGKNSAIFAESIPSSPVYADNIQENGLFQLSSLDNGYGYDWFDAQHSLARFGSTRSSRGFDHGHELPLFDDTDPFRSTGPFKTSVKSQSPREDSDKRSAF